MRYDSHMKKFKGLYSCVVWEHFHPPQKILFPLAVTSQPSPSGPWQPLTYSLFLWTFHISGITHYVAFFCLASFRYQIIHVVACISILFLLYPSNIPLCSSALFCLSSQTDVWVVATFWLLGVMPDCWCTSFYIRPLCCFLEHLFASCYVNMLSLFLVI